MKLIVNPHKIEIEKTPINEREIDITKCEFEFAEEITNEYVKEAYFTFNGKTYKQIIVNNQCDIPNEVLAEKGQVEIGVVAFIVENNEEIKRYNPSPAYFNTWLGSLKDNYENSEPITPTDKEQIESIVNNAIVEIDAALDNVETAVNEANNLDIDVIKSGKVATVTLTKKDSTTKEVTLSDGTSLMFNWDGTRLGIKTDDEQSYTYVDLKGTTGNGIQSIELIGSANYVDTYQINYTDGTSTTYNVTNANQEELGNIGMVVKDTILNTNNYRLNITKGSSFLDSTGGVTNNDARARTNYVINKKNLSEIKLSNADYQFAILYYSQPAQTNFQNYYVNVHSDWTNDIILKNYNAYGLRFRRVDGANLTDNDVTNITNSIRLISYTDNLFKTNNVAPNSLELRNMFNEFLRNDSWIESDRKKELQMALRRYYNRYTGERSTSNNFMSTYTINLKQANRVIFSSNTYNMRVYYYNGYTSSDPGLEQYYLGYDQYTEDIDLMIYSRYYILSFWRKDGEAINQDSELNAIKNSFTLYTCKNNYAISDRVNFYVTVNGNVVENNEADSNDEISVLGTLIMPSNYTKTGEKIPIVCLCHGAGESITTSVWGNATWLSLANTLVNAGYAVFGCNRLPTSVDDYGKTYGSPVALDVMHKAFQFIKERYNVQDKMFVHGSSMGGATAQAYALMYPNDVIAISCFAPANTMYSLWRTGNNIRSESGGNAIAQCFGYETRALAKEDNYDNLIGYMPALIIKRYNTNNVLIPYTAKEVEDSVETAYDGGYWFNNNEYRECEFPVPIKCWCGTSDTSVQNEFTECLIDAIRNAGGIGYIKSVTGATHNDMVYGSKGNALNEMIMWFDRFK